jgi:hypothetical protein
MAALVKRNTDGSTEGRHPVSRDELQAAGHDKRPLLKVIRAKCLDCSAGSDVEVRRCTAVGCSLWPYRMGNDPFTNRKGNAARFAPNCGSKTEERAAEVAGVPSPDREAPPW